MVTIEVLPERRQAIEIEIPASPEFDQLVMMEDFPVLQDELDFLPSVVVRKKEVHYEPAVETPKRKPKNVFTKLALRLKKSIRRKSLELREEELEDNLLKPALTARKKAASYKPPHAELKVMSLEDTLDETELEMTRPTSKSSREKKMKQKSSHEMHRDTCTLDNEPLARLTEGITRPPLPRTEHHYPRALSEPSPLPHPHPLPGEPYLPAQSVPAPPPHPPLQGAPAQYVPASPPPRSLGSLPRSLPAVPLPGASWDRLQSEEERSSVPRESLKMAAEIGMADMGMADMGMDGMGMDDMTMCALSIDQPRGMSTNTECLLSMQGQVGYCGILPVHSLLLFVLMQQFH